MSGLLQLKPGDSVRIKFQNEPFQSRIIHWVRDGKKWSEVSCALRNCPRCIAGDRAQQRFSAAVIHKGQQRYIELPLGGWKLVAARYDRMSSSEFYATTFELIRLHDFPGSSYDLVPV